ncbi:hypothetical protein H4R35_007191 [Dimargaris xerosporica]|nr:hypothetical protein H4R35_007191 [Dimargaris xerosporica]
MADVVMDDLHLHICAFNQGYVMEVLDLVRARYIFNDIVAFQVIPELITAYAAKGYYEQVVTFIEKMRVNPYMVTFWESIPPNNGLDYYE